MIHGKGHVCHNWLAVLYTDLWLLLLLLLRQGLSGHLVEIIALLLLPVAIGMCGYAIFIFIWRSEMIAKKRVSHPYTRHHHLSAHSPHTKCIESLPAMRADLLIDMLAACRACDHCFHLCFCLPTMCPKPSIAHCPHCCVALAAPAL